ncbi:MAG: AMP-binding protein [Oscillospiraceae bacterium]|nr:AMP-binding protein [Oscillospiraceae bacterium]
MKESILYSDDRSQGQTIWPKFELIPLTMPQVLETVADTFPDQLALYTDDASWTYAALKADSDKAARALIAMGVQPGDHVAIWATNVAEYVLAFWACTSIGAVLVTVNTGYKRQEVEYLLKHSDAKTLIMVESFRDINYGQVIQEICPELAERKPGEDLCCALLPELRGVITIGFELPGAVRWNDMLARAAEISPETLAERAAALSVNDICNIQYTSGTTGFPKGVMLSHYNIINTAKIAGDVFDQSTGDKVLIVLPLFHCFGIVISMLGSVTHGSTMYPMSFSPTKVLEAIGTHRITVFSAVPTMYHAIMLHPDCEKTDFSTLRTGGVGGAACPTPVLEQLKARVGIPELVGGFGQTECGSLATLMQRDCSFEELATTVGPVVTGVEVKIVSPETGEDLPDNTDGEMVLRGFNVMQGYYKAPDATAAAIDKNGWLHTGDIAQRDEHGNYKITGRIKDMIIRGGENIFPREMEEFLHQHPKVADVQVVGVPDPAMGEEAFAWVIRKDPSLTEAELREFALEIMARHKVPRYIGFCDSFPMNVSGKVLKYKLREMAEETLAEQIDGLI